MIIAEICTLALGIWIGYRFGLSSPKRVTKPTKRGPVNLNE
jgi:hypothetical protein